MNNDLLWYDSVRLLYFILLILIWILSILYVCLFNLVLLIRIFNLLLIHFYFGLLLNLNDFNFTDIWLFLLLLDFWNVFDCFGLWVFNRFTFFYFLSRFLLSLGLLLNLILRQGSYFPVLVLSIMNFLIFLI